MKRIFVISGKGLATLLIAFVAVLAAFSVSPVYRYGTVSPFSGPDIFDPYSSLHCTDTCGTPRWKRANFHTHTRVDGLLNECDYSPAEADSIYRGYGYDIVTFSNHNELTAHPFDSSLQVNVYEHGYNLFKFHKLVFGAERVNHFDHILPLSVSQKQWQIDMLAKDADFVQLNHPYRTNNTTSRCMRLLTGYRLIELDSGIGTAQEYWDEALSAGRYSFGTASDDLHHPETSDCVAVRTTFLHAEGCTYDDIRQALSRGSFYAMRVPDYGEGDFGQKRLKNAELPRIVAVGAAGDSLYLELSAPAEEIRLTGQGGKVLAKSAGCRMGYRMSAEDSYARFTAFFDDGGVIYTNPFARYDSGKSDSPYRVIAHEVSILPTIMFNLLVLLILVGSILALVCLWHKNPEPFRQ